MQVDLVVVLLGVEPWGEVRPGVLRHEARLHGAFDLVVELLDRADADLLLPILCAPDRQRGTPVATTREVPVLEVLEPLTEATRTGALGLPVDLAIELHHLLPTGCGTYEPAI